MAYRMESKKAPASAALAEAFGGISSLADEMEDWASNLESSNLASTQKCSDVREAADNLQGIDELEMPDAMKDTEVTWLEAVNKNKRRGPSRSARRDTICSILDAVATEARAQAGDELEEFANELDAHKDTLESVEFPGMF